MIPTPAACFTEQHPLPVSSVRAAPASWLGRLQRRNTDATLPHVITQLESSDTLGNLRRIASGPTAAEGPTPHVGFQFSDSDLHKTLEAIGWEIARTGTTGFDAFLADAVALLAAAQEVDGYLNSWGSNPASPPRWTDLAWGHELYVGGHLIQAAIALARAGRPDLLAIARRWADLVVDRFGPGQAGYCGHPEVETALAELSRETGHPAYAEAARAMVERRGSGNFAGERVGAAYFQDHAPVTEATEATGHAVRQLYLDAGVADLVAVDRAAGRPSDALLARLVQRWESAHDTKLFLSGALGSRHRDEAFGPPYELSPDRVYAETCAALADLMLSWRLLLLTGEARYADAIERVMFNALPASLSTDGRAFFYSNPLQLRTGTVGGHSAPVRRTPWYACACCPPNIARVVASLNGYLATVSDATVTLHQYAAGEIDLPEPIGGRLIVETDYPLGGSVVIRAEGTRSGAALRLRVPAWATTATLDGLPIAPASGYVAVPLVDGGEVRLDLDLTARLVTAHPRADALRGCVAVVRGPVVYCAEQADLAGAELALESLVFDPVVRERLGPDGHPQVMVTAWAVEQPQELYQPYGTPLTLTGPDEVVLHPYADWGNRSEGPMRVWLPVATRAAASSTGAP